MLLGTSQVKNLYNVFFVIVILGSNDIFYIMVTDIIVYLLHCTSLNISVT